MAKTYTQESSEVSILLSWTVDKLRLASEKNDGRLLRLTWRKTWSSAMDRRGVPSTSIHGRPNTGEGLSSACWA